MISRRAMLLLAFFAAAGTTSRVAAQTIGAEVLGSVEFWKTDAGSRLLALNDGDPMILGRLYGFAVWQPTRSLRLMAIGEAYGVTGDDSEIDIDVELLSLRWWHSRALRIEAGKILLPIGEFASRRFANVNPLIGMPDTYVSEYPLGGSVTGAIGAVDYTAAVVSLPAVNVRYTPEPGARLRPVVGVGVSAGPGFRIGAAVTHGSYLSADLSASLPAGTSWDDFNQTVVTVDAHFSRGRFDTRAEAAWSSYDVPTVADPVRGLGWYAESRASISPRLFVAARFEDNRYPFVMPVSPQFWVGTATTQMNGEVGLGYQISRDALVKTSLRKDHWPVHDISGTSFPDGYAFAVQFSLHADLVELLTSKP
jgi:hypothetical protein